MDCKNEYMTIPEMQVYLHVSRKTAYTLAASDKIPTYRISQRKTLVKKTDIDNYVKKHKR